MLAFGFAGVRPSQPTVSPGLDQHGRDPEEHAAEVALKLAPWLISSLVHIGLVLLAVFVVWRAQSELESDELIIPTARLSATAQAPLDTRTARAMQAVRQPQRTQLLRAAAIPTALSGKDAGSDHFLDHAIAVKANPFDTAVRKDAGLEARFFSVGGNARRIIYLVDASGSLIDTMPFVIVELKRSIGQLSAQQQFTVIFFQEDKAIEVPPAGLKRADDAHKLEVIEWIDTDSGHITPKGQSNPMRALRLALRYEPQLLFILSDNITGHGRYEIDQRRLLADIDRANKAGTKINTIQFLYRDRLESYGLEPTLKLIAQRHGGAYKFLDAPELGIE